MNHNKPAQGYKIVVVLAEHSHGCSKKRDAEERLSSEAADRREGTMRKAKPLLAVRCNDCYVLIVTTLASLFYMQLNLLDTEQLLSIGTFHDKAFYREKPTVHHR